LLGLRALGWWIKRAHPGVVLDPDAFGADAWLDVPEATPGAAPTARVREYSAPLRQSS